MDSRDNREFKTEKDLEEGKSFKEYWQMVRKHWKAIIVVTMVALVMGIGYSEGFKKPEYQSTGTCMVLYDNSDGENTVSATDVNYSLTLLATVNTFMEDEPVIDAMTVDLKEQGYNVTTNAVRGMISVNPANYSSSIKSLYLEIVGLSADEDLSRAVVNSCLSNSVEITNNNEKYNLLKNTIIITSDANSSTDVSTSTMLICAVSVVMGLIVGIIYAIIKELTNVFCISKKEIESITGVKVLGLIPDYSDDNNKDVNHENNI